LTFVDDLEFGRHLGAQSKERGMKTLWIAAAGSVAFTLTVGSDGAFAQSSPGRKPIRHMTCSDFVRIDDGVKPEIVYWLATRNEPKSGGIVIDVDATDSMVPALVERCKDAPTASLSQKVKAETERLGKKLWTATTPTRTE
jgi:hypothetical protein